MSAVYIGTQELYEVRLYGIKLGIFRAQNKAAAAQVALESLPEEHRAMFHAGMDLSQMDPGAGLAVHEVHAEED